MVTAERTGRGRRERGSTRRSPGRSAALAAALLLAPLASSCATGSGWLASVGGPPPVESRELYARRSHGPVVDHGKLDELLAAHVSPDGLIDYAGLWREARKLDQYLDELALVDVEPLGRDEALAFWIDAYNACTLRLVLDHYPIDSILDVPEDMRWQGRTFPIAGRDLTLAQIENDELRAAFVEPRLHFALCDASRGGPPLRAEAYVGARIDAMLADQARRMHAPSRWFRWDPEQQVAHVASVYERYRADFEQAGGDLARVVARYAARVPEVLAAGGAVRIEPMEADWSLNDAARPPSP